MHLAHAHIFPRARARARSLGSRTTRISMAFTGRPALEAVDENTGLIYMPPASYMPPIVEGSIPLFQPPPPPMILRSTAWPVKPLEVKICAGCGKSLRKAAFSKTQWRTYPNRPRCNVCTNSDRAFSAAVKKLPPLPATVAVSVSTSASSATVSVSVTP